jgi:hypothetical protein
MPRQEVFIRLKEILTPYDGGLEVSADRPECFELSTPSTSRDKKGMLVAAVRDGKAYTSFHLMPVYAFPELLDSASPELRKRMQGRSCFNFSRVDEALFGELADLTSRGLDRFGALGARRRRT